MNLALARVSRTDTVRGERGTSGYRPAQGPVPGFPNALRLLGPAFVAAIAFVDPGNFATNVSAGALFGYELLWTVLAASVVAMLVQYLSAKLAMTTGLGLAEVCREHSPTPIRLGLWVVAELVVITTDLAEFVGGAIALNLLFGISPLVGGVLVSIATVFVLSLRMRGREVFPAVVMGLLFLIAIAFVYMIVRTPLDAGAAAGGLVPHIRTPHAALLACGIVGATVMPHAVFLHSSLVGGLDRPTPVRTPAMLRFLRRDVIVAMCFAGVINALMLLVGTQVPSADGDSLASAHAAFSRMAGSAFATIFAIALLASGLASATAGVYSGQAVMQGFLRRNSNIWLRRVVSAVPALVILALVNDPTEALVLSQVALAFGLPFALIPLLVFTARRSLMGRFVNRRVTSVIGILVAVVVIALNAFVLGNLFGGN
jgi:manganese transport protein